MMHDEQHFTSDYSIWSNKIPTTIYKDIYHSAYCIYKIVRTTNFTTYPWMFIGTDFSSKVGYYVSLSVKRASGN